MSGVTVKVREETHATLRVLAQETKRPIQDVLARAVEAYRRQRLLELTNAAYATLRADPAAWQSVLDERTEWGQLNCGPAGRYAVTSGPGQVAGP